MIPDDLDVWVRLYGVHVLRVIAAVFVLPSMGPSAANRIARLVIGLGLALPLAIARAPDPASAPPPEPLGLVIVATVEIVIGLILGLAAGLILEAATIAGSVIATEMGVDLAAQVDPTTRHPLPFLGFLFQNLALLLFFAAGGQAMVLGAITGSYAAIPVGQAPNMDYLLEFVLELSTGVIVTGVRIAAPVFFVMIVVTVGVGLLAKVAPNLGLLEASYPIRILGALVLLVIFLPTFGDVFDLVLVELGSTYTSFLAGA